MFNDLLIQRSNYLGYQLTMQENDNHGWVGGSAPQWFEDKEHLLTDESQLKYGFFLSVKLPVSNQMVSIFIPELAEAYSHAAYPCGIKAIVHPVSPESASGLAVLMPEKPDPAQKLTKYQRQFDYSLPVLKKAYIAPPVTYEAGEREFEDFIQFGGQPAWVQQEEKYYANQLLDEGYEYIMQVNEDQYLPDMVHGNYPFYFGALYLYGKTQTENEELTDLIAAFWQNS